MLSTTTPFKIHDENAQAQTHLTSAKKRSLATSSNQSGLPLNFSTKTPQKSILSSSAVSVTANKTSRKALVDLSSSQVNIRVPNATPSHTLSLNINKQPTNVIKATPSHVKTTTIATPSTARQSGTVQASSILPQSTRVSESDDDKDDEMICTRSKCLQIVFIFCILYIYIFSLYLLLSYAIFFFIFLYLTKISAT